uniref:Glycosyltransferase 2-like domain-containing protein n=1 Tax=Tetraselmis sp. GSL018 TaxID=582737 RepID=A0A061S107_9CHLO|eukprot:CAMPEP_0177601320 /NCGR_PEP_ID=MMETSP0419_2-20121207/14180_1 /TAXON_ID=582737 /ORGANISM="Tetraselmis sp., Strain GSL018" /LENGTH=652 /DNA_ID=CAMNT_0019094545 /DNA_START=88 /DNA_END=2046 /DNA_ORIENTATION=-
MAFIDSIRRISLQFGLLLVLQRCFAGRKYLENYLDDNSIFSRTYLEVPEVNGMALQCKTKYKEWSPLSLAAVQPNLQALSEGMKDLRDLEVLASIKTEAGAEEASATLDGPNHFIVFHTQQMSQTASLNRLVPMANSEVVLMVLPGDEIGSNDEAIEAALREFARRPKLGLLGFSHARSVRPSAPNSSFAYAAGVSFGPVAIRRKAFLEVGGLSEEVCAGGCEASAALELSSRMWSAGYSVGVYAPGQRRAPRPCDSAVHLRALNGEAVLKAAAEASRPEPTGTQLQPTQRVPIHSCSRGKPLPNSTCSGGGGIAVSIIMQFFRRGKNIQTIMKGIKDTAPGVELLVNDDSRSDWGAWVASMEGLPGGGFLVYSPDIHEIRGYNRLAKLARGELLVFLQDDDAPKEVSWLLRAQSLFRHYPELHLLGGNRGRMDSGKIIDEELNYVNGPKYGPSTLSRTCCRNISTADPKTGVKFMFVYKINMGPMIVPRHSFLSSGMFHTALSCAGDPGIGFDYEYSIRMWYSGQAVGLYYSGFQKNIGDHVTSGTRGTFRATFARKRNELRNNKLMYTMYKGFHHQNGTRMAMEHWSNTMGGEALKQPDDDEATVFYLEKVLQHRSKRPNGGPYAAALAAREAGVMGKIRDKKILQATEL